MSVKIESKTRIEITAIKVGDRFEEEREEYSFQSEYINFDRIIEDVKLPGGEYKITITFDKI